MVARAQSAVAVEQEGVHAGRLRTDVVVGDVIADVRGGGGRHAREAQRVVEDARVWLLAAGADGRHDEVEVVQHVVLQQRALEPLVEVRHDAEPQAARPQAFERRQRVRQRLPDVAAVEAGLEPVGDQAEPGVAAPVAGGDEDAPHEVGPPLARRVACMAAVQRVVELLLPPDGAVHAVEFVTAHVDAQLTRHCRVLVTRRPAHAQQRVGDVKRQQAKTAHPGAQQTNKSLEMTA